MILNKNLADLQPSVSIQLMQKAKELQKKYGNIIDLAGGEPDFATPQMICDEAVRNIQEGYTHYTVGSGLISLREKIANKLLVENNCVYTADEIIITPGAKFAIYLSLMVLLNPGDEVILFQPGWVSYKPMIESLGGKAVEIKLHDYEEYEISLEQLEKAYTARTKVVIINYPNNPTGKILKPKAAECIKEFLKNHKKVFLISDEIYEKIVYNGMKNISMASYSEVRDRILTINGFSKAYAMTGWRLGYVAADQVIIKEMYKLYQHMITCVSGFIMKAGIRAFECSQEVEKMRCAYEIRRKYFVDALNSINGIECSYPEGTFYAWVKFKNVGKDSRDLGEFLLREAHVVGVPGNAYGEDEEGYMRFSFANSEKDLDKAIKNIKRIMEV